MQKIAREKGREVYAKKFKRKNNTALDCGRRAHGCADVSPYRIRAAKEPLTDILQRRRRRR